MDEINTTYFDRFSLVHMGVGVWFGSRGFGLVPCLIVHTTWELLENYFKRKAPGAFPFASPDSTQNSVGDTLSFLAGWSLSLKDRLKEDPWIGETNLMRLVW